MPSYDVCFWVKLLTVHTRIRFSDRDIVRPGIVQLMSRQQINGGSSWHLSDSVKDHRILHIRPDALRCSSASALLIGNVCVWAGVCPCGCNFISDMGCRFFLHMYTVALFFFFCQHVPYLWLLVHVSVCWRFSKRWSCKQRSTTLRPEQVQQTSPPRCWRRCSCKLSKRSRCSVQLAYLLAMWIPPWRGPLHWNQRPAAWSWRTAYQAPWIVPKEQWILLSTCFSFSARTMLKGPSGSLHLRNVYTSLCDSPNKYRRQ